MDCQILKKTPWITPSEEQVALILDTATQINRLEIITGPAKFVMHSCRIPKSFRIEWESQLGLDRFCLDNMKSTP
jgi:hypothetical protein